MLSIIIFTRQDYIRCILHQVTSKSDGDMDMVNVVLSYQWPKAISILGFGQ